MGYATRTATGDKKILMNRQIAGEPKGMDVDHRNRNKLDNRRENLRVTSHSLNMMNRPKQSNNSSGFKGVSKKRNKWTAEIKVNGVRHRLGVFDRPEDAADAYREAAARLAGEFAHAG